MAYGNKYISSQFTRNGHTHRLIIAENGYTGASKTLEGIKGIWLEVQGSSESIETPIVKTNLSWTVTDAPDKNKTSEKWGGWEELFTPDALKYRVQLQRDGAVVWTGFITPDSWNEALEYHAPLTFTARDLIGHLSDFDFDLADVTRDADGLSSVKNVVEAAWSKAGIPMSLSVFDKTKWLQAGGNNGYEDFLVDLSVFEGKTWYQVVEETLASMGLILRYTGTNTLWLAPLRFLPYLGSTSLAGRKNAVLLNRSGVRTIDLSYKRIIEQGNYEIYADDVTFIGADEWDTIPHPGTAPTQYVRIDKAGWYSADNKVYPYDPEISNHIADVAGEPNKTLLLLHTANRAVTLRHRYVVGANTPIKISATFTHIMRRLIWVEHPEVWAYSVLDEHSRLKWEHIVVDWRLRLHPSASGLNDMYLSAEGQWTAISSSTEDWTGHIEVSNRGSNAERQELNFACTTPVTRGELYWECNCTVTSSDTAEYDTTLFTIMDGLTFAIDGAQVPKGWKVTTNYDEAQNTILKRDGIYGVCPSWVKSAGTIKNGICLRTAVGDDKTLRNCYWGGESSLSAPLPVWAALQILTYHSKANSVFEGDIKAADDNISFGSLYRLTAYEGSAERILYLRSGVLDLMTGYVTGAILQECGIYATEWAGITSIDYTLVNGGEGEYGSGGASGGGGSASGGGGSSHTHPNKSVLDAIQEASITHWDAAYSHSQIGVAATTPSGNPHNTTWAQIYSASGNAKILTDYIGDNQVTIEKLESALSWLSHCHYSNGTLVLGDENNAINFAAYGEVTAGGIGSGGGGGAAVWGGIEGTLSDQTDLWNALQGKQNSLGTGTNGQILSWQNGAPAWVAAPATGVTSLGGVTGAISVRGGQTANGSVNLAMSGTQLQASIVGLGSLAYLNGLSKSDVGLGNVENVAALPYSYQFIGSSTTGTIDLNSFTQSNKYDIISWDYAGTSKVLNQPWSSSAGNVFHLGGTYPLQIASFYNSNELQIRTYYSSTGWTSWSKIAFTSDIPTNNNQLTNGAGYITSSGSCAYATSAGNADTVDNEHSSAFAHIGAHNNLMASGNEFTFASSGYSGAIYLNYRTAGGTNGNITDYLFCNGAGATLWTLSAIASNAANGNAAYNSLGNYLPLTGGNITGSLTVQSSTVYHSGNANNPSTPWTCLNLSFGSASAATNADLEVVTIGGQRYLHTHLPFFSDNEISAGGIGEGGEAEVVTSFNGRSGQVTLYASDVTAALGTSTPLYCSNLTASGNVTGSGCQFGYIEIPTNQNIINSLSGFTLYLNYSRSDNVVIASGGGNVGIGTTSPSEKLHVAGNILASGTITPGSDARWKHSITPVVNGIDAIMRLQPSEWEWNSDNHKGSGLVAQQTREVLPHLVKEDSEGYLHLTYDGLHAYEISALQSHETRIERLERENKELRQQIQRLRS